MSHGCHTCGSPNGCYCQELREYETTKAALDSEVTELIEGLHRFDETVEEIEKERERLADQIAAKRKAWQPKADRLKVLLITPEAKAHAIAIGKLLSRMRF